MSKTLSKIKEKFDKRFPLHTEFWENKIATRRSELWSFIETALKAQAKQLRHDHQILVNTILDIRKAEIKTQREKTLRDVRKWTKGRNVTKDSLRNYLNILDKLNK